MPRISFSEIEVWRAEFPLRLSFAHSLSTRERAETILVALRTRGGTPGHGQALPRPYLTGETPESVLADIRDDLWPALAALDFGTAAGFGRMLDVLRPLHERADGLRKNAAYAALECAALDAVSRERGLAAIPEAAVSGRRTPLVGVAPATSPGKAAWLVRAMRCLGYRRFKVKVGTDARADDARLAAVRKAIGGAAWLAVDANRAWTPEEAAERAAGLRRFGVEVVEEPLRREYAAEAAYSRLEKMWGVGIMADESICTIEDAERLLERGTPSWWNLRLGKNGGFAGVGRLARLAAGNGVRMYGGVLVGETSILAAAGRNALLAAGAECLEYGFPRVFLEGDPFRGGPGGFTGFATKAQPGPGFGVTLLRRRLAKRGVLLWRHAER